MKIKIAAYSCSNPSGGGSFQYAASILEALSLLDKEKYDIHFFYEAKQWDTFTKILPYPSSWETNKYSFIFRVVRKCIKIINRVLKNKNVQKWSDVSSTLQTIIQWDPQVCISLEQQFLHLPQNIKIIGPIHDLMHRYQKQFPEVGGGDEYQYREFLFSNHALSASAILVDSNVGKQHVIECYGTDPEKIHVLPFVPSALLSGEGLRPQALPQYFDHPFIFYPAQFWLHKNHAQLLNAIQILEEKYEIYCILVGDTQKSGFAAYQQARAQLKHPKRIFCLGYVTDEEVIWLYKNARCMIMPTFFGPTNIPPLEALQYGCPTAVSGIYGMPEQLGDAALYFNPNNPEEIAHRIEQLWLDEDLRKTLQARGFERTKQWNKEDFQKRFLEILKKTI
jgi:glycosyltransferase involved in cell wall biosynthesis